MTIVDSSVWIEYFTDSRAAASDALERQMSMGKSVGTLPVILTEVLMGFRSDSQFNTARNLLLSVPMIHPDDEIYVGAARLFRALRRRGVTVRGAIDCLIAQTCIVHGADLFTLDRDFEKIARYTPLMLASVSD